jgi:DNA-binding transcriptional LysR family regulator
MELRHLHYFVAVAEELHYGQAARRLCISTPTLSQQIKDLEREIGATLFHRDSRQVSLTPAGEALLPEARAALRSVDHAVAVARRSAGLEDPVIRLGLLNGITKDLVVRMEQVAAATLPGVRQVHTGGPTSEQLSLLQQNKLDLGLVRLPLEPAQPFGTLLLSREELGVLVTADHPLASYQVIDPAALDGQELIWFASHLSPGFHRATIAKLHQAGAALRVSETTVPQAHLKRVLLLRGDAIGLGTRRTAEPPEFQWRPISGPAITMDVAAAWLKPPRDHNVQRLIAALRQAIRAGLISDLKTV